MALAVREYNREFSSAVTDSGVYYMEKDDTTGYVLIGSDNVYEAGADNSCTRIEADENLIQSIQSNGSLIAAFSSSLYLSKNNSEIGRASCRERV